MPTRSSIIIAAALTALVASATASVNSSANTDNIEVASSVIQSERQTLRVAREYAGRYQLADGRLLKVMKIGKKVFAETSGNDRFEVRAIGANRLVAVNGTAELRFYDIENGKVVMSTPARSSLTQVAKQDEHNSGDASKAPL
jgi:hypothetical protein